MPTFVAGVLAACLGASLLGGCVSDNRNAMASAPGAGASGATLTIDSIDGPPQPVFARLVQNLDREAQARGLPIVSRDSAAQYYVRGYLSAHIRKGQTSIAWVWDIYNRAQERTLRLSGEEPVGRLRGDAWAGADEKVLRKIAQAGINGFASLVGTQNPPDAAPAAPAPARPGGPAIARLDGSRLPSALMAYAPQERVSDAFAALKQ